VTRKLSVFGKTVRPSLKESLVMRGRNARASAFLLRWCRHPPWNNLVCCQKYDGQPVGTVSRQIRKILLAFKMQWEIKKKPILTGKEISQTQADM
jgi:hypothetical protein